MVLKIAATIKKIGFLPTSFNCDCADVVAGELQVKINIRSTAVWEGITRLVALSRS